MDCLIICRSGNYALKLSEILSKMGYYCEVASTPCKLAREGCSYCIKFDYKYYEDIKEIAKQNNIDIVSAYRIEKRIKSNKYVAIN